MWGLSAQNAIETVDISTHSLPNLCLGVLYNSGLQPWPIEPHGTPLFG